MEHNNRLTGSLGQEEITACRETKKEERNEEEEEGEGGGGRKKRGKKRGKSKIEVRSLPSLLLKSPR